MYRERPSRLTGAVVWRSEVTSGPYAVLPDGCMDLIWSCERLLVAGPDTGVHHEHAPPGTRFTGLRFPPGVAPAVLGVPASDLTDQRVPLDALWPSSLVRRLTEQVGGSTDLGRGLEAVATTRLDDGPLPDLVAGRIAAALAADAPVAAVVGAAGLSERHLRRRCRAAFGYGPKTLARILRFQRALSLLEAGSPPAEAAAEAGYADQSHLARETCALAGTRVSRLQDRVLTGPG